MGSNMPFEEALMAMIAMMVVLVFILIFYCFLPCYKLVKKRNEELENWWEVDPRWNNDRFTFTPKLPEDYMNDKKYSRMAACEGNHSRNSSCRSDVTARTLEERLDLESGSEEGIRFGPAATSASISHMSRSSRSDSGSSTRLTNLTTTNSTTINSSLEEVDEDVEFHTDSDKSDQHHHHHAAMVTEVKEVQPKFSFKAARLELQKKKTSEASTSSSLSSSSSSSPRSVDSSERIKANPEKIHRTTAEKPTKEPIKRNENKFPLKYVQEEKATIPPSNKSPAKPTTKIERPKPTSIPSKSQPRTEVQKKSNTSATAKDSKPTSSIPPRSSFDALVAAQKKTNNGNKKRPRSTSAKKSTK